MKNKKSIRVKALLSIGAIATISLPIAAVISCGSGSGSSGDNSGDHSTDNSKYSEDVVVSGAARKVTDNFGDGNFANPKLTYAMSQISQMENKTRKVNGQPYSIHYHFRDVLDWTAGKDTDGAFSVGTIPLKDRVRAGKILASQKDKQLQILGALSQHASGNFAGTVAKKEVSDRVFQMWSQVTSFVGWGGSGPEGNFVIPKGGDINAAHRNGVPLLGTLFLPPDKYGGKSEYYDAMTKKDSSGGYPMADKMVAIANYFGFDGWFLNFESTNNSKGDMKGFMKYFHDKMVESKLFTVLYDFEEGQSFMRDKDDLPFDEAAFDFSTWDQTYATKEEQRYYGYDYNIGSTDGDNSKFADKNIWMYSYFNRHDIDEGDKVDLETFDDKGGSRDPRTTSSDVWQGLSTFAKAYTPITDRTPFSSSFETGIGSKFYINGKVQPIGKSLTEDGYRNQGLQDVLPTWKYINDEYSSADSFTDATRVSTPGTAITDDGATWKSVIDETGTPFYGSSNLHYTGKISTGKTMINRLFGSEVTLKEGDKFSIVVQGEQKDTGLALWLQDSYDDDAIQNHATNVLKESSREVVSNDLNKITYVVPKDLDGKVMSSFGLAFGNTDSATKVVDYHIGQINYTPVEAASVATTATNKLTKLNSDGNFLFLSKRNIRINWEMEDKSTVDHYVVWGTEAKTKNDFTKKEILTASAVPAAYLKNVDTKKDLNIVIDAVDANDNIISSNKVVVKTSFKVMNDKSKWSENFERESGVDADYTITTGNEYTASFKDADGNLYIGDNNSRIHKIGTDGAFKTDGTKSWGQHISKIFLNKNILKIFQYDDQNIGAVTNDGVIHVIDKETGEQNVAPITSLQKYWTDQKEAPMKEVQFFSAKDGKITIFATTTFSTYVDVTIDKDGSVTALENQSGDKTIKPINVTKNEDGTVVLTFKQGDNIGIKQFSSVDAIDLMHLTASSVVTDGFKEFTNSDAFKNSLGTDLIGKTPKSVFDGMAETKIKLVHRLTNGDILLINNSGLAIVVDKEGNKKAVTSLLDKAAWTSIANSLKVVKETPDQVGFSKLKDGATLATIESMNDKVEVIGEQLSFDEKTNSVQGLIVSGYKYQEEFIAPAENKLASYDLTSLIGGTTPPSATLISETQLPTESDKKIGSIKFIQSIGDVIVMGGSDAKIAVFDSKFNQLTLGKKEYLYDGEIAQSVEMIYDDQDSTIPAQFYS